MSASGAKRTLANDRFFPNADIPTSETNTRRWRDQFEPEIREFENRDKKHTDEPTHLSVGDATQ
jgi:hypothetical protein